MRGYQSVSDREEGTSLPVSTGLGGALGAVVRPFNAAQFVPQYGAPSVSDYYQGFSLPPTDALFRRGLGGLGCAGCGGGCGGCGTVGGLMDDIAAAQNQQMTQPQESPRDPSVWSFLQKGLELVPTAAVKGVTAYKAYETSGGGSSGVKDALLTVFGPNAQQAQAAQAAQAKAAAEVQAAQAKSNTGLYVALGLAAVGVAWAVTRRG